MTAARPVCILVYPRHAVQHGICTKYVRKHVGVRTQPCHSDSLPSLAFRQTHFKFHNVVAYLLQLRPSGPVDKLTRLLAYAASNPLTRCCDSGWRISESSPQGPRRQLG